VNGAPVTTLAAWSDLVDQLRAGESLRLHVAGNGESRDVSVTAVAWPADTRPALGLGLRRVDGQTQVTSIDAGSAGEAAGLRIGDVLIQVAGTAEPTPAQVRRAFAAEGETPLLMLYSRGGLTHAAVLKRR
jgi:membrane-associated protease RseP (regulator of RpoE activity)